jgi:hypothetical protein
VAPLAAAQGEQVLLGPALEALLPQEFLDPGPRLEGREPLERPGVLVHRAVGPEQVDHLQAVPLAHLEVVEVVGRRHLHRAGPELRVDQDRVGDDRDRAPGDRVPHRLAVEVPVPLVVRVDRHRGVAEHGLGPGGGDHYLARAVGERIGEGPQLALHVLLVLDLQVGQRGVVLRAPVDQPRVPVDQALLVEADEHLAHRAGESLVEGEALAVPVEGRAENLVLLLDPAAVLGLPLPDPADELRAAEVVPALPLGLLQLLLHDHLRGDARVIGAREPEGVEPAHPLPADQDVLDGVRERVAHVQGTGHVRRRDDDAERGLLRVLVGVEVPALHPEAVPVRLDVLRLVALR